MGDDCGFIHNPRNQVTVDVMVTHPVTINKNIQISQSTTKIVTTVFCHRKGLLFVRNLWNKCYKNTACYCETLKKQGITLHKALILHSVTINSLLRQRIILLEHIFLMIRQKIKCCKELFAGDMCNTGLQKLISIAKVHLYCIYMIMSKNSVMYICMNIYF